MNPLIWTLRQVLIFNIQLHLVSLVIYLTIGLASSSDDKSVFKFHFEHTNRLTCEDAESQCQALGYDGLAIVKSPEAYDYALKMTEATRSTENVGFWVGLHFQKSAGGPVWDDGSLPSDDTPWSPSSTGGSISNPCFCIRSSSAHMQEQMNDSKKYYICGQHKNLGTYATGETIPGAQIASPYEIRTQLPTQSYQECVILCSMDYMCRMADFNTVISSCRTFKAQISFAYSENPYAIAFLRNNYLPN